MSTPGALAGLETFNKLNIEYENAYHDNRFKVACVSKAMTMIPSGTRALDVGCGTGVPVSEMLSKAGLEVVGCDISPQTVELAHGRVKGSFIVSELLEYKPKDKIRCCLYHFLFSWPMLIFTTPPTVCKHTPGRRPFVIGKMPADKYIKHYSD